MLNMCKKGLQTNCFLNQHRTGHVMLFTYPLCLVLSKCPQRTASETMRPWHRKWHFGLRSSMRRSPSTMSWAGSFWVVKITWICTVRELCVSVGKNGGERMGRNLPWDDDLILRVFPDLRCNPIHLLWEMLKMDGTGYFQITKMFCYRCKHNNLQCYDMIVHHTACIVTDACHEDITLRPQNL